MNITTHIAKLRPRLPGIDRGGNMIRDTWDRLHRLPGGKHLFSRLIGVAAPYSGSVGAVFEDLAPGHARVTLRDRRAVRNHLHSIHAVALVNLGELAAGGAMTYSLPDDARFIVTGLTIDYLKKARGTITAVCNCEIPLSNEQREYELPVALLNESNVAVARLVLRALVGPKRTVASA